MRIIEFSAIDLDDSTSFYFKISTGSDEYEQKIEVSDNEIVKDNCTCAFGNTWRFAKGNENKTCKHIKYCTDILRMLGYLK